MSDTNESLPDTKEKLAFGERRKYYSAYALCPNCQKRNHLYIIKGCAMKYASKSCERCSCNVSFDGGYSS